MRLQGLIWFVCACFGLSICLAQGDSDRDDFLRIVKEAAPKRGFVEIVEHSVNGTEIRSAIDFSTGAMYKVMLQATSLVDATGAQYAGEAGYRRLKPVTDTLKKPHPQASIADKIPVIWLWLLAREPSMVVSARKVEDGYDAQILLPLGGGGAVDLQIEISGQGEVTRAFRSDASSGRRTKIKYLADSQLNKRWVADNPASGWRVVSHVIHEQPVANTFHVERIESVGAVLQMNMAKAQATANAGTPGGPRNGGSDAAGNGETPVGPERQAGHAPFPPAPGSRWRWPLAGAGLTLLVVGVGALWWKRRR